MQDKHKKLWTRRVFIILVMLMALGTYLFIIRKPVVLSTFSYDSRLQFNYSQRLELQTLSDKDKKDQFIFRATEAPNSAPFLVTVRYEEGLEAISALAKQPPLDLLVNNSQKAYPQRFPGYKEESVRQFELNGHEAAETYFTYKNNAERIKQRFLIVLRDSDIAFYVAAQAKETDFEKINNTYFQPIFESIDFP